MSRRPTPGAPSSPAAWSWTAGEAPGGSAGAPEDGWADPQRDDLPRGLAVDGVAPIGRGGSLDFADPEADLEARLSQPKTPARASDRAAPSRSAARSRPADRAASDRSGRRGRLPAGAAGGVAARLGCPLAAVEAVLRACSSSIRRASSPARSKECLALQLREANRLDPAMAALLDHLDLLVEADIATLAAPLRDCPGRPARDDRRDQGALPQARAGVRIRADRRGGARHLRPAHRRAAGGSSSTATTLPKVLVNHNYYVELCRQATDKPAKAYLSERLQSANWLVKALDQRARTLLKVAEAVVAHQLPCLERGVHHLRPLLLRDIAEATELHESTVSRATADKYLATPRGNFPFRYFFSNALPAVAGGAGHAAEAIRQQIKAMIEREEPRQRALRRSDRRGAAPCRRRDRAPHRRQISRGYGDPIVGAAPPRQGFGACLMGRFGSSSSGGPSLVREAPHETSDGPHRDGCDLWRRAGRSLHGDRSCGSRQLEEQNRRLPDRGFALTGRCKHAHPGVRKQQPRQDSRSVTVTAWSRLPTSLPPTASSSISGPAIASARC